MAFQLLPHESVTAAKGILVLPHARAVEFNPAEFGVTDCVMIRIESPRCPMIKLEHKDKFKAEISLWFEDNDRSFQRDDAELIKLFFEKYKDVQLMVVHCFMGISRSPAVAAAFARYIGNPELEQIFFSRPYVPNQTVYHRLVEEQDE